MAGPDSPSLPSHCISSTSFSQEERARGQKMDGARSQGLETELRSRYLGMGLLARAIAAHVSTFHVRASDLFHARASPHLCVHPGAGRMVFTGQTQDRITASLRVHGSSVGRRGRVRRGVRLVGGLRRAGRRRLALRVGQRPVWAVEKKWSQKDGRPAGDRNCECVGNRDVEGVGGRGLDLVHVQALSDETHLRATTSAPTRPAAAAAEAEAEWGTGTARKSRAQRVVIRCVYACACVRERTRARTSERARERPAWRLCSE